VASPGRVSPLFGPICLFDYQATVF
jgi:hypothetical protein